MGSEKERIYPIKLFSCAPHSCPDESHPYSMKTETDTIVMKSPGKLVCQTSIIKSSAHFVIEGTGTFSSEKEIPFEELGFYIGRSTGDAEKYAGMNEENWESFI